jgi:hypothetical protein
MSRKGHDDTKDTAPEERIGRMKQQLDEMSGGDLFAWESDVLAPEIGISRSLTKTCSDACLAPSAGSRTR